MTKHRSPGTESRLLNIWGGKRLLRSLVTTAGGDEQGHERARLAHLSYH